MIIKLLALAVVISLTNVQYASAHFFVSDNKASGAVIHISPDDDPVAGGELSTIHFDVSSDTITTETYFLSMDVTEPNGERTRLAVEVVDTFVIGEYQFDQRGSHTVTLIATNKNSGATSTFEYVQEVTRSSDGGTLGASTDTATKIIAVWSLGGLLMLAAVVVMRKRSGKTA